MEVETMTKAFLTFILVAMVVCSFSYMMNKADDELVEPAVASPVVPSVTPWLVPDTDTDSAVIACEALTVVDEGDRAQYEPSKERMVQEVVTLWEIFFDDDRAPKNDPRREHFFEYAEYLVNAVLMYQNTPTDLGGILPRHRNTHLLLAQMITKESSVIPSVRGKRGEVCLLQIHGPGPLVGHKKKQVSENPKLCLLLGTRWLASRLPKCFPNGVPEDWSDEDWLGPLSLYAGGGKAYDNKKRRCKKFGVAKERIEKMKYYRTRIDHEMEFYQD
jgi:hypothetical protein